MFLFLSKCPQFDIPSLQRWGSSFKTILPSEKNEWKDVFKTSSFVRFLLHSFRLLTSYRNETCNASEEATLKLSMQKACELVHLRTNCFMHLGRKCLHSLNHHQTSRSFDQYRWVHKFMIRPDLSMVLPAVHRHPIRPHQGFSMLRRKPNSFLPMSCRSLFMLAKMKLKLRVFLCLGL